jgi:hypothetical protein
MDNPLQAEGAAWGRGAKARKKYESTKGRRGTKREEKMVIIFNLHSNTKKRLFFFWESKFPDSKKKKFSQQRLLERITVSKTKIFSCTVCPIIFHIASKKVLIILLQ